MDFRSHRRCRQGGSAKMNNAITPVHRQAHGGVTPKELASMPSGFYTRSVAERFWSKVDIRTSNECWPWLAQRNTRGYGQFKAQRNGRWQPMAAHRMAWWLTYGNDPNDLSVCHTCDNPPCCNPAHLWLGTTAENMADRNTKGRQARGMTHGWQTHPERIGRGERVNTAKLTAAQVLAIRAMLGRVQQKTIAYEFGVSTQLISAIATGRVWRHLEGASS